MSKNIKTISIIGDGGWGTTLAVHLARNKRAVTLWGPFADYLRQMKKTRHNTKFLPGIRLPEGIGLTTDLKSALETGDLIVFAVPSKYAAAVLRKIKKTSVDLSSKIILSVTKGIDTTKLLRISEIIRRELGPIPVAVLSGPTIAYEVAQGLPSTAVVASRNIALARKIQAVFNAASFRIYTNTDVIGTELGGSIKNIIALACGVCDGLGFGSNTKAAILTRGLAEMARLGAAMGARQRTFSGLTGLGDLVTTCVSPKSRNRTVGEQLGRGKLIKTILSHMDMVAEGVETVKAVHKLSHRYNVSMPITTEVYNIIYRNKKPSQAVADLMKRKMKAE
ncbi:MAG: glycerol-3-phosphate dehydrogenase [Omnitrophica WOR_2 bacterium RIFCSPHIGHO2_02_FULL_52_10]|nr:MAG: glycerol-3-phosphate dehydrogenase [Omnitrophica WOR_2 bacterium RIFCSPHIGHO2_02_FULL_52_10]